MDDGDGEYGDMFYIMLIVCLIGAIGFLVVAAGAAGGIR